MLHNPRTSRSNYQAPLGTIKVITIIIMVLTDLYVSFIPPTFSNCIPSFNWFCCTQNQSAHSSNTRTIDYVIGTVVSIKLYAKWIYIHQVVSRSSFVSKHFTQTTQKNVRSVVTKASMLDVYIQQVVFRHCRLDRALRCVREPSESWLSRAIKAGVCEVQDSHRMWFEIVQEQLLQSTDKSNKVRVSRTTAGILSKVPENTGENASQMCAGMNNVRSELVKFRAISSRQQNRTVLAA